MAVQSLTMHAAAMNTHDADIIAGEQPQQPKPDPLVTIGRAAILLTAAIALGCISFGLLFIGSISLTGCFFSCSDPDYVAGLLAAVGWSISLAAMITAAVAAFVRIDAIRFALRTWMFTGALAAIGAVLLVANP